MTGPFKLSLIAALATTISGCSELGVHAENDSLCGAQLGNPCTTIQDADGQGGTKSRSVREDPTDTQNGQLTQNVLTSGKSSVASLGGPDGGAPYYVQNYRTPERLGTAWIAPRLDSDGIFHEATFVHFVVREAGWKRGARPAKGAQ